MAGGTGGQSPLSPRLPTSTPACLGTAFVPAGCFSRPVPTSPSSPARLGARGCALPGAKSELSDVLAGQGIWWGRRGHPPQANPSTPVPIPQCSARTSPMTASLKGHWAAACPLRCGCALPHLLLTLPNLGMSSHTGQTSRKKRAQLKADPEALTPKVRSFVVVAPAGSRGCPVPCALLRLLLNSRWGSYVEFLIIWRSKHASAAKLWV